jgi:hypothetical protein
VKAKKKPTNALSYKVKDINNNPSLLPTPLTTLSLLQLLQHLQHPYTNKNSKKPEAHSVLEKLPFYFP